MLHAILLLLLYVLLLHTVLLGLLHAILHVVHLTSHLLLLHVLLLLYVLLGLLHVLLLYVLLLHVLLLLRLLVGTDGNRRSVGRNGGTRSDMSIRSEVEVHKTAIEGGLVVSRGRRSEVD